MSGPGDARPVLRLVRGSATPEELAALVAVVVARSGSAAPTPAAAASSSRWAARGPGSSWSTWDGRPGWRWSSLPGV